MTNTKPVSAIDVDAFDAIIVAGGQAPMFTFETADQKEVRRFRIAQFNGRAATVRNGNATVTGHVVDTSGAPVAGATVTVRTSGEHATADSTGAFTLDVPAQTDFTLSANVGRTSLEFCRSAA